MSGYLEHNLSLLQQYDPTTADFIRNHTPSDQVEIITTPENQLSLKVHHTEKPFLLHSGRNPQQEAKRWVQNLDLENVFNVMVFGVGMFYHIFEIVYRIQKTLKNLVLIEKEPDVIHAVFRHADLTPFLRSQSTFFLIDPEPRQVRTFMNDHLTPFIKDGLEMVEHPASCALHPEFYRNIRSIVDESIQSGEILLRTKVQLGGMIQENVIRNVPHMLSNPNLTALKDSLTKVPAFLVGAGPSLDRNMEYLSEVGEGGIIIAVDTVYRKLRDHGIQPHLVVTSDPTPLNQRHFEGVENLDSSILVFSPSVLHRIPEQLQGTKISIPLPTSRFLKTLQDVVGSDRSMKLGINVGQTCFNLARYLGCDPLILVGFDFSFPREGGETHASGTALRRTIKQSPTAGKMQVELITETPEWEEFEPIYVPANDGGEVATNKFWFAYLRSMEEEIFVTQANVINCTEGGARIEGADIRPLQETIREVCYQEAMVRNTLQMTVGFFFDFNQNEGRKVLEESLSILNIAISKAEEGLSKVNQLETTINSPHPQIELVADLMNEIVDIHRALVQDRKVYVVLDEAADRVLHPFLKEENRPQDNRVNEENARLTMDRYRPYFHGMYDLCVYFRQVIQETLETMNPPSPDGLNW